MAKSFFARRPTHSQQLKQLIAENTMLKQRLLSAENEQKSLEYWKAASSVVIAELHAVDQTKITEETPFSEIIEVVAKNIVAKLEKAKKKKAEEASQPKKEADNEQAEQAI